MSSENPNDISSNDLTTETCDDCGETYTTATTAGPGRCKRSCGCDAVLSPVADDTPDTFANVAIRALNADGDVETAAEVHEGARGRLVTDGGHEPTYQCRHCDWAGDECDRRDHYPVCPNCSRIVDVREELVADGGVDPEEMSLEDLREEYLEVADIGYSDPDKDERKMALWHELRDRVDVEQPECPTCGERNWGQAPGEPVMCNACGDSLGKNPELREEIQAAWNEIMYGDADGGRELVADGGEEIGDRTSSKPEYRHVTAVRILQDDPVNDRDEGDIWFVPGEHFNGDDYRVLTDEQTVGISTETVAVFRLEDSLPGEEATDAVVERARDLIASAPEDVLDDEQELATDGGVPESFDDLASTCESCGDDVHPERLIEGECPGCHYHEPDDLVADGGTVQAAHATAPADVEEPLVACGGMTSYTGMKLHGDRDCPSLQNAVDVRPATDGEIESREWCGTCVGEPERGSPDWSAYRAAANAGSNGGEGK